MSRSDRERYGNGIGEAMGGSNRIMQKRGTDTI